MPRGMEAKLTDGCIVALGAALRFQPASFGDEVIRSIAICTQTKTSSDSNAQVVGLSTSRASSSSIFMVEPVHLQLVWHLLRDHCSAARGVEVKIPKWSVVDSASADTSLVYYQYAILGISSISAT